MSRTNGGKRNNKQGKRSTGARPSKFVFQPGERTIPTTVAVEVAKTGVNSPMASAKVPLPDATTDPAGVRVLGWRIVASSTEQDLKFNLGSSFGKQVTLFVPVEKRGNGKPAAPLSLDIIGSTESVYAVTYTRTIYYIADALSHVH